MLATHWNSMESDRRIYKYDHCHGYGYGIPSILRLMEYTDMAYLHMYDTSSYMIRKSIRDYGNNPHGSSYQRTQYPMYPVYVYLPSIITTAYNNFHHKFFIKVLAIGSWHIWSKRNDYVFNNIPVSFDKWKDSFKTEFSLHMHMAKEVDKPLW
uniref:Uncharacterized protein n=1 Tax=Oryza glaberrima TaxID=4538 RepID=I1PUW8_ORYGL